ncbi:unnamed protein product [Rhodiola kirilowii]
MLAPCSSSQARFSPPSGNAHISKTKTRINGNNPNPTFSLASSVSVSSSSERSQPSEVSACESYFCLCGRRRFIGASVTSVFPIRPSRASELTPDYKDAMKRFRPQKPDWYEELFATAMDTSMKPYEAEVTTYKSQLFAELKGKASEVLELGIGTGPNLKYYAGAGLHVIGVDPNAKMEKYAKAAATAAGLQVANFDFRQAVGEALPLANASVDAVVGTLVLCSVGDVNRTLSEVMRVLKPGGLYLFLEHVAAKDGTFLRIIQTLLDPLQEALADGCHLTQNTGQSISQAGFSKVDINSIFVSSASLLGPHVYGIAVK